MWILQHNAKFFLHRETQVDPSCSETERPRPMNSRGLSLLEHVVLIQILPESMLEPLVSADFVLRNFSALQFLVAVAVATLQFGHVAVAELLLKV